MSEANSPRTPTEDPVQANPTSPKPEEVGASGRPRAHDKIPRQFGRYRIMESLGRGGMGVVFKAHDNQLNRVVALKIPFLDSDDHEELRHRFFREARAAAALHHANICPVFDVGEFNGVPYLTMAFIDGRSLLKILASEPPLPPARIALLVRKLALAMQEAHQHGVVHRDLKPANVILRLNGEPVIMDFGLARRADDNRGEAMTRQGDILGTVEYMSPEQVDGDNSVLGPSTDIYSLGVIMYEMMCGRRPFEGSTASMLAAIITKEPPRPTELRPDLPLKLEEICQKAMAKKPSDRFASMSQFAAALADFLRTFKPGAAGPATEKIERPAPKPPAAPTRPISDHNLDTDDGRRKPLSRQSARPKSSGLRRQRSGRRRRSKQSSLLPILLGGSFALLAVVASIVALIVFWPRGEKKIADSTPNPASSPATRNTAPAQPMGYAPAQTNPNRPSIPNPPVGPRTKPAAGFSLKVDPETVTMEVGQAKQVTLRVTRTDYQGPIRLRIRGPRDLRVTANGSLTLNPGQPDPTLTLRPMAAPEGEMGRVEISAAAEQEPQRSTVTTKISVHVPANTNCLRIIDLNSKPKFIMESAAFAPDLSSVLVGGGDTIQEWNLTRGESTGSLVGHHDRVTGLSFTADGKFVLSVSADRTVVLWDLVTRKIKRQSVDLKKRVVTAAMSPDGRRGLVVYAGSIVRVNFDTFLPVGQPINTLHLAGSNADDAIQVAAVSSERKGLVGGINGKLFVLDVPEKGRPGPSKPLTGHTDTVLSAAFAPNGKFAASAGKDKTVRLWDIAAHTPKWTAEGHQQPVVDVAFSSDGALLASGDTAGAIHVWNALDGKPIATFTGHSNPILGLAFAPDGKSLWSAAGDKTLRQWRLP